VVPGVDETERELALSYERTGDALFNLKKFANAREMYDENLKLRKKLALAQPLNNEWQGELAVAYDRIGARVECQTNPAAALHAIRQALEIRKKLVIKEPQDAIWQQGLAASYNYDGSFLLAAGKNGEAAAAFRKSLAIREALAAGNPDNAQWQANLIITLVKLAEAGDDAKQRYIRARAIASDLQQKGKLTASQQDWPDMIEQQLADLETNPVAAAPMPCEGA
jgi:tetratricopeptide (TPR) repeat protein